MQLGVFSAVVTIVVPCVLKDKSLHLLCVFTNTDVTSLSKGFFVFEVRIG